MKPLIFILTFFVAISACNSNNDTKGSVSISRLLLEPDILERLRNQKIITDTLFNQSKDKLIVFVKLGDQDEPVKIKNANFPDDVETTFNVLKDSIGRIVTVSEFPFSESGDWNIILTHYFDTEGKTFAFERQTNFFNSICTDGVAYETRTEFYNSDFQLIKKMNILVDEKNQDLQKDSCQFPYDYKYKVSADIDEYLKTHKLKNSR